MEQTAYDEEERTVTQWDGLGNVLQLDYSRGPTGTTVISDGTFTYTYNAAGRMVQAESLTTTLMYTYTADGLRVAQSVGGDVTTFAWDWASGLPEMLTDGDNLYLVGHDTLGSWDGAAWVYHLPDALGSVRQVADSAGAVVSSREWTPFGVEVGAPQAGLGFTGEWWDAGVGLQYLRARWYLPRDGVFLSRDPVESEPPYQYVRGNPINRVDPSGYIIRPWGVGDTYYYSCKCGWIDLSHAGSKADLIEAVLAVRESERMWDRLGRMRPGGLSTVLPATISADFLVRRQGVFGDGAYEVALGIHIAWENFWEAFQGYGIYAATQSSFSEEDLVSDLIGFHIGYGQVTGEKPDSLKEFMKLCEVVGYEYYDKDRATFEDIQWQIYVQYITENGMFRKHYQWGCRPPGRWSGRVTVDVGPQFDSARVIPPIDPYHGICGYSFSCDKR